MSHDIGIRPFTEDDYEFVASNLESWGGSATVKYFVLRRFIDHFCDTCFVAEVNGEIAGYLIGWLSQTQPDDAFINSVAVAPEFRQLRVASGLYRRFFRTVKARGRTKVSATIRPANQVSLDFHTRLGFRLRTEGAIMNGEVPVLVGWDGPGEDKVLAEIDISGWAG
jgi:ribosomal protein S18 acetylase RimI-like enzyme